MNAKSRVDYIENIIETLRSKELHGPNPINDFDKLRLSSSTGILLYDGLAANSAATNELTKALEQASKDLQSASAEGANAAKKLNRLTIVLAVAAALSVLVGGWQGWQTKRQADLAELALKQQPTIPAPAKPAAPK